VFIYIYTHTHIQVDRINVRENAMIILDISQPLVIKIMNVNCHKTDVTISSKNVNETQLINLKRFDILVLETLNIFT